jgi:hypothetical protein
MKYTSPNKFKEAPSRLKEENLVAFEILMNDFAEIEYQYFLEKNERLNAASEQPTLEISQNMNQKFAA